MICPPIHSPNPFISTALTVSLYSPNGWQLSDAHDKRRYCDRIRPQRAQLVNLIFSSTRNVAVAKSSAPLRSGKTGHSSIVQQFSGGQYPGSALKRH